MRIQCMSQGGHSVSSLHVHLKQDSQACWKWYENVENLWSLVMMLKVEDNNELSQYSLKPPRSEGP